MKKDDIAHLASLSRIKLTDDEIASLETELPKIIEYVGVVSTIVADDVSDTPTVGARHNVLRKDEVTNEPGSFTKDILEEMPDTKDSFLKVKKILHTEE